MVFALRYLFEIETVFPSLFYCASIRSWHVANFFHLFNVQDDCSSGIARVHCVLGQEIFLCFLYSMMNMTTTNSSNL